MARRKNNRTPQENEAISNKVDTLLSEGYPIDQATAIAFRMFHDGELVIAKETTEIYRKQYGKKKTLLEAMAEAAAILKLGQYLTTKNK